MATGITATGWQAAGRSAGATLTVTTTGLMTGVEIGAIIGKMAGDLTVAGVGIGEDSTTAAGVGTAINPIALAFCANRPLLHGEAVVF